MSKQAFLYKLQKIERDEKLLMGSKIEYAKQSGFSNVFINKTSPSSSYSIIINQKNFSLFLF